VSPKLKSLNLLVQQLDLWHAGFFSHSQQPMPLDTHDQDEDGYHAREGCELCIENDHSVTSKCDCGACCQRLIIEASFRDAEREPRIASECSPLRDFEDVIGYSLNDKSNEYACHFFDRETLKCTIYETRPLVCRVSNCDDADNPAKAEVE
jgi:hypothetical protein